MISHDAKLLAVYDKLEKQIKNLQLKHGIDGKDGADGISIKGDQGDRGHEGLQGLQGLKGLKGADGDQGDQGDQGVSIVDAKVDFDNHLVISLSDGTEIDAGELKGGSGGDQYYRSGSKVNVTNVESDSERLKEPVFTYTGGLLTLVTYSDTTTKELTYTDSILTQLVQTSPNSPLVTKTFNYTDGVLTSITET